MKKIGITQRMMEEPAYDEIREGLDIMWAKWFQAAEMLPILLPSQYDFQVYVDEIGLDGVILSGGNDLNCISPKEIHQKRDDFERIVIQTCIERQIPLVGICRGMQMIGHYFGMELQKVSGHIATPHQVYIQKDGQLASYNCSPTLMVNSFHQYAFTNCSDDFIIEALSADAVIEAFSHKKHKIYGQMWHPERAQPSNKEVQQLLRNFLFKSSL